MDKEWFDIGLWNRRKNCSDERSTHVQLWNYECIDWIIVYYNFHFKVFYLENKKCQSLTRVLRQAGCHAVLEILLKMNFSSILKLRTPIPAPAQISQTFGKQLNQKK